MASHIKNIRTSQLSFFHLFIRFLKFGFLAWGGPIAQIDMIRKEIVEDQNWISKKHFNRVLGIYQILPGPEATELCVYFGYLKRGRLGGFVSGLGFFLPGFLLMLVLSWFYVSYGVNSKLALGLFYGGQAAVAALIVRGLHRIGTKALFNHELLFLASLGAIFYFLSVDFIGILVLSGLLYLYLQRKLTLLWFTLFVILIGAMGIGFTVLFDNLSSVFSSGSTPSMLAFFVSGLKTGLLTFGGAYTAIPFLQHDAISVAGYITNQQFLDGLVLSGLIPAPLIIFGTFVGYIGGGLYGAMLLTAGIFLPAFSFTLLFHNYLEKLIQRVTIRTFLDGVTAGVIGMIVGTSFELLPGAISDFVQLFIFVVALVCLYRFQSKSTILLVMFGSCAAGLFLFQM